MSKFYKKLSEEFGPNTIFELGKSVPDNAQFPPGINSIEAAFQLIDTAYNMNHQGYVGFYKVEKHDVENKTIVMHCYNPYLILVILIEGYLLQWRANFKQGFE
ncbi:MAG: hypothetical protein AB8E82_11610 [Aureispira sp.]